MTSAAPRDQRAVRRGPPLGRTAATIAGVAIAARFVGVLRVFVQTSALGVGELGDAYISANRLPNIVFDVVAGGALSSVVIPVLSRPMARGDDEGTRRTASALLTWTLLLLVPLSLLGMLLSRPLMTAVLSGVDDPVVRAQKIDVAARMLVVFMPQMVLYGVGITLTGVLQAHRRFLAPAIAPLLSSVVVIGAYLAYAAQSGGDHSLAGLSRGEELTLSLGTTLGVAALTLPLLLPTRQLRLRLRPNLRMPGEGGHQIRRLAAAGAVALGAQQLTTLVIIALANRGVGGLVVYELAWTMFMVPWAVLAVPIATSVFPELTRAAADGDTTAYAESVSAALAGILTVMLASAAVLAATASPVAELLLALDRSAVGPDSAELAWAITAFAPGLVGYGLVALLTRAAYARIQPRPAAAATAVGFATAAVLDVLLAAVLPDRWLVAAIGIGNTIGMTVAALLLLRWLHATGGAATTVVPATRAPRLVGAALAAAIIARVAIAALPSGAVVGAFARAALGSFAALALFAVLGGAELRSDVRAFVRAVLSRRSQS